MLLTPSGASEGESRFAREQVSAPGAATPKTGRSSPPGTRRGPLGGFRKPLCRTSEDQSARQQHGVDDVDDAVRLLDIRDGDCGLVALAVDQLDAVALELGVLRADTVGLHGVHARIVLDHFLDRGRQRIR